MIRTRLAVFLGLVATFGLPAGLRAQTAFEGVISYRMNVMGADADMRFLTKGQKTRMELQVPNMPGEVYILVDVEREVMQVVMAGMGMYMEMNLKDAARQVPGAGADEVPPFRKLGTSDVIVGIPCENYRFGAEDKEEAEACIATGMGWFMGAGGGMGGGARGGRGSDGPDLAAYRSAFKDGMLPLRMSTPRNGQWEVMLEATAVEPKSLEDGLFVLPPGLQKMTMPGGE